MMRPIDYLTQPDELWYWLRNEGPRNLWDWAFAPQSECIDYIDFGVGAPQCVGEYDTPSRAFWLWVRTVERLHLPLWLLGSPYKKNTAFRGKDAEGVSKE